MLRNILQGYFIVPIYMRYNNISKINCAKEFYYMKTT